MATVNYQGVEFTKIEWKMDLTQHQSMLGTSAGIKLRRDEDNQQDKAVPTRRSISPTALYVLCPLARLANAGWIR